MLTKSDYEKCEKSFRTYIDNYDMKDDLINRKFYHSYKVADLMEKLANKLSLSEEEIVLARIIGLLHDIGRFEQARKFHSFLDKNQDHADAGCTYLFAEGHIRDFVEISEYDDLIEHAIRYHNKLEIKKDNIDNLLFSKMIRDMDKVDIYNQLSTMYEYRFGFEKVTSEVMEDYMNEKTVDFKKTKCKSDKVLLVLAYVFDINYKESLEILLESGNLDKFIKVVKVAEGCEEEFEKIKNKCLDNIKMRIGDEDVR